jgi:hypothetical protein
MSPLILVLGAWTLLCAGAFVVAVAQAVLHFLPPAGSPWQLPTGRLAPTLAEERVA